MPSGVGTSSQGELSGEGVQAPQVTAHKPVPLRVGHMPQADCSAHEKSPGGATSTADGKRGGRGGMPSNWQQDARAERQSADPFSTQGPLPPPTAGDGGGVLLSALIFHLGD